MKRIYIKFFVLILLINFSNISAQTFQWVKKGSSKVNSNCIISDNSGNSYVTGYFTDTAVFDNSKIISNGGQDIFIAKYNSSGILQWVNKAGGTGDDQGNGIVVDNSGNIYIVGSFSLTSSFGSNNLTSRGSQDIFIAKYNSSGAIQWIKQAGGSSLDRGYSIAIDNAGYIYSTGFYAFNATFDNINLTSTNSNAFIAKYNSQGQIQYAQKITNASEGKGIKVHSSGNIYLIGNGPISEVYIAKFNSAASLIWSYSAQPNSNCDVCDSEGGNIDVDAAGNAFVIGKYYVSTVFDKDTLISTHGDFDLFIAKFNNSDGKKLFVKALQSNDVSGFGITVDSFGNFYISGPFTDSKFDGHPFTTYGSTDVFIAKYDNSGNIKWVKNAGGSGADYGTSISVNSSQYLFITGVIGASNTIKFDNFTLSGSGSFVSKLAQPSDACTASGTILREYWANVPGYAISSIPVNTTPTSTSQVSLFEGPSNIGDNYGARYRGYICAPLTGNYTFWIASDDNSELWLSTDDNPTNKVKIAFVTGYTASRQWDKYASQKSNPIALVSGHRYYIEALHKEATGNDNLAVGWQLPNTTFERPIPGNRLSPYTSNNPPIVTITSPTNGQTFIAPSNITINANAGDIDGSIAKVEFFNGSTKLGEDPTPPYNFTWTNVGIGSYILTAKATDNLGAQTTSAKINISVNSNTACTSTGTILRELWSNVAGANVASIPLNTTPTSTSQITIFEGPTNDAINYGARYRGYLCAPSTGSYVFWIASDDYSELWLSSDDNPANKVKIAFVNGWTNSREWTEFTSQQSGLINLVAGHRYYIEALHKQSLGGANLAVGWKLPNGTLERPIPGNRLSPYTGSVALAKEGTLNLNSDTLKTNTFTIDVFPNPTRQGFVTIAVSGYDQAGTQLSIEVRDIYGAQLYVKTEFCDSICPKTVITLNERFTQGLYFINIIIDGKWYSKKLIIE